MCARDRIAPRALPTDGSVQSTAYGDCQPGTRPHHCSRCAGSRPGRSRSRGAGTGAGLPGGPGHNGRHQWAAGNRRAGHTRKPCVPGPDALRFRSAAARRLYPPDDRFHGRRRPGRAGTGGAGTGGAGHRGAGCRPAGRRRRPGLGISCPGTARPPPPVALTRQTLPGQTLPVGRSCLWISQPAV